MNTEVQTLLSKSPHPLPYTIAILTLLLALITTGNIFAGIALGFVIGSYFGNYRGRFAVMEAWRRQLDADHRQRMAELRKEYGEQIQ